MGECKPVGMQRLSAYIFHIGMIQIVPDQREAKIFHMYPDLMGTACLQMKRDQAVSVFFFYDSVMGNCRLTVCKVHRPFNNGAGLAGKRRINGAGEGSHRSPHDGKILPVYQMPADHVREDTCADQVLCDYGKAGGVPVQPVAAAEDERLPLFLIIPGECICHGIGVMVQRRVDGHPGRLVDDNEVFVLEYDVQGKTDRRNLLGASGFAYLDLKAVACRI